MELFDLALIWAFIIGFGVIMYVLMDGFDLGVGILFPFAPDDESRDVMMNSVAPVWDGNETWLVLGGAGLLAAFPMVYSILLPALYIGVFLMLAGLISVGWPRVPVQGQYLPLPLELGLCRWVYRRRLCPGRGCGGLY